MAFRGMIITYDGQSLLTQTQISKQFAVKCVRIGDGKYSADHHDIHSMVNPLYDVVPEIQHKDNQLLIEADITSNDHSGYYLREIGIITTDASGQEVLYAYDNAGNDAEYINPVDSGIAYEKRLRFALSITDDITINIQINGSVYALQRDLVQHCNDHNNPHNVTVEQLGLDKVNNTADKDKPISDATKKALDGKEPVFSKNSAFNKAFGNSAGTVCQGNDSRLNDARTPKAHNHNDLYHTKSESDQAINGVSSRVTRLETNGVSVADTLPVGAEFYYEGDTSLLPDNVEIIEPPFSNGNWIINGGFQVWQRGTSLTKPNSIHNEYLADRWMIFSSANIQNLVVSKSNFGGIRFQNNGDNGYFCIIQQVELNEKHTLMDNGKKVTLSFEIDSNMSFNTQCTVTPNSVIEYEVKQGKHKYEFCFDFISDEETMSRGYFNVYPFTSNIMIPNGADFTIKWVKIEVGSLATPFVPRPYAEELMLCQRYGRYIYMSFSGYATVGTIVVPYAINFDIPFRIAPSLSIVEQGTLENTNEPATEKRTDNILFVLKSLAAGIVRIYSRKYWADAEIY